MGPRHRLRGRVHQTVRRAPHVGTGALPGRLGTRLLIGSRAPFRNAFIPHEKIVDYLLDPAHPDGGPKAVFFLAHGFRRDAPKALADALLAHVAANPVVGVRHGRYGAQIAVEGPMDMPDGTRRMVLSVWLFQDTGDGVLVTAYPRS